MKQKHDGHPLFVGKGLVPGSHLFVLIADETDQVVVKGLLVGLVGKRKAIAFECALQSRVEGKMVDVRDAIIVKTQ